MMDRSLSWQSIVPALAPAVLVGCSADDAGEGPPSGAAAELSEEELVERFFKYWVRQGVHFPNTWFGISTLQNPLDVWITQEIFFEVKPDFIVETGTYYGGSAALWATILEHINPEGRVITIDVEDRSEEARKLPIVQRKVDFILGSSIDPEVVADVEARVRGRRVLVILDSLHTMEHVLAELKAYAPLVEVGSYIIVQDGLIHGHPIAAAFPPGPYEAVEAFLETTDDFEVDRARERMVITNNPKGYLRRVR